LKERMYVRRISYLVLSGGEPETQVLVAELGLEERAKVVEGVLATALVEEDLVEGRGVHGAVVVLVVGRVVA